MTKVKGRFSLRRSSMMIAVAAAALCSARPASAAPVVSLVPGSSTVIVGDVFTLDVAIDDVIDLYAYQFDINFDPLVLQADGIIEGAFLSIGGGTFYIPGFIDDVFGAISFTANTLISAVPGVTGGGVLATVTLRAVSAGSSTVTLSNSLLLDSSLSEIADSQTRDADVTVRSNASVPEPAPLALLALASGDWCRRRRKISLACLMNASRRWKRFGAGRYLLTGGKRIGTGRCMAVVFSVYALSGAPLHAQTSAQWNVPAGFWSVPSNWLCGAGFPSGCVPNGGTATAISNGGTSTLDGTGAVNALAGR